MSRPQIRSNQLITTFGPGAMVDLPDKSVIIAGLEEWSYDPARLSKVEEPRLAAKLARILRAMYGGYEGRTIELRSPPPSDEHIFQKGAITPGVGAFKFPHWFVVQKVELSPEHYRRRRLVHQDELEKSHRMRIDGKTHSVVPVRFVRACRKGHVGDIQWSDFVHGARVLCKQELWMEERGSTGDIRETYIVCGCGARRSMRDATEDGALGKCNGAQPWLDDYDPAGCKESNKLLIRTASNAYFPQMMSVISIPNSMGKLEELVLDLWDSHLKKVDSVEKLGMFRDAIAELGTKLEGFSDQEVFAKIEGIRSGEESHALARPVKEIEYEALSAAPEEAKSDRPDSDFYVRQMKKEHWSASFLDNMLDDVVLVHRLREVVALTGFTRFEPQSTGLDGELDLDVQTAVMTRKPTWVPASENRGEGIFLRFNAEAIQDWEGSAAVQKRKASFEEAFERWSQDHGGESKSNMPGVSYVMLHSLSHMLISAISLECGYPLSSLRERIYAPDNEGNLKDCYGILIYTSSSGSEGTLGGLVHASRDIRKHFQRALQLGTLCSNDPVCSSKGAQHGAVDRLNGSACHGCLYIAETSCERFNQYLDRSLVVTTLEQLGCEAFAL